MQKQNQVAKGRTEGFRGFRDVLAEAIRNGFPELREDVERVLEETGGP